MKCGSSVDLGEIHTMKYLSSMKNEIPMPRPLGAISINGWTCIFMSYVEGVTLESIWPCLESDRKTSIQCQLAKILQQLRQTPIPSDLLGSGNPPRCKDLRRKLRLCPGPIKSEVDFNEFLAFTTRTLNPQFVDLSTSSMSRVHNIVMAHGDLHPKNILVQYTPSGDLCVASILDWELSGAYPEYWDYVKALNGVHCSLSDWYSYLPVDGIGHYPKEWMQDCLITRLQS